MLNWKNKVLTQQPDWPNIKQYKSIINTITDYPNLVSVSEIHSLKNQLAQAAQGNGFILQGGDCAETFSEFSPPARNHGFFALKPCNIFQSKAIPFPPGRDFSLSGFASSNK